MLFQLLGDPEQRVLKLFFYFIQYVRLSYLSKKYRLAWKRAELKQQCPNQRCTIDGNIRSDVTWTPAMRLHVRRTLKAEQLAA